MKYIVPLQSISSDVKIAYNIILEQVLIFTYNKHNYYFYS